MVSTFHTTGARDHPPRAQGLNLKANFSCSTYRSAGAARGADRGGLDKGDKDKLSALHQPRSPTGRTISSCRPAPCASPAGRKSVLMAQLWRYHRQMVAHNALDFDDLIVMPTLLLKSAGGARALAEQDPLSAGR